MEKTFPRQIRAHCMHIMTGVLHGHGRVWSKYETSELDDPMSIVHPELWLSTFLSNDMLRNQSSNGHTCNKRSQLSVADMYPMHRCGSVTATLDLTLRKTVAVPSFPCSNFAATHLLRIFQTFRQRCINGNADLSTSLVSLQMQRSGNVHKSSSITWVYQI